MAPKNRKATTKHAPPTSLQSPPPKRVTRSITKAGAPLLEEPPAKKLKVATPKPKPQAPAAEKAKKTTSSKPQPGTRAAPKKELKIIIEASKICQSFRNRAMEVREGLTSGVPGIVVEINPEKPRKGCFEIRDDNGVTFVSLLDMPRPFKMMKALDMKQVVSDIIAKVK